MPLKIVDTHTINDVSQIARSAWVRRRLGDSGRAFVATVRNRALLLAQLSFAAAWTAEWAFTVALGGGGIQGGRVVGETDRLGATIVKDPVTVPDLFP